MRHAAALAALVSHLVDEACNKGNLAVLDAVLPPAAPVRPGDAAAAERLRPFLAEFRAAVPDARWTIAEQVAAGDTVVTRLSVRGTFAGPLVGLAPPGRLATVSGVVISRFAGGHLVDLWLQADLLGLLLQLGVLPPLDLAQVITMAQVQRLGALLAAAPAPTPAQPPTRRRARGPPLRHEGGERSPRR
jgi:predicted ester cyclase